MPSECLLSETTESLCVRGVSNGMYSLARAAASISLLGVSTVTHGETAEAHRGGLSLSPSGRGMSRVVLLCTITGTVMNLLCGCSSVAFWFFFKQKTAYEITV